MEQPETQTEREGMAYRIKSEFHCKNVVEKIAFFY